MVLKGITVHTSIIVACTSDWINDNVSDWLLRDQERNYYTVYRKGKSQRGYRGISSTSSEKVGSIL